MIRQEIVVIFFVVMFLFILGSQVQNFYAESSTLLTSHLCETQCAPYNSLVMNCASQLESSIINSFESCLCSANELDASLAQCFTCSHYWVNSTKLRQAIGAVIAPCNRTADNLALGPLESLAISPSITTFKIAAISAVVGLGLLLF
ncbi:hypothetical protein BOTBODRAFT_63147 [Botryobasidium botryosum FD-172 SS1]|uniref:Uncharacterized protein n=1 Tax=Botryobasidium botryosum (strain FD-172 SS1) TaxID=930990 RepID=A0A067MWC9_BOTB1|nr:hypothetical protein BOTBODRAFT_63147 [Botryobasidium botryosum FD-172 SS1]